MTWPLDTLPMLVVAALVLALLVALLPWLVRVRLFRRREIEPAKPQPGLIEDFLSLPPLPPIGPSVFAGNQAGPASIHASQALINAGFPLPGGSGGGGGGGGGGWIEPHRHVSAADLVGEAVRRLFITHGPAIEAFRELGRRLTMKSPDTSAQRATDHVETRDSVVCSVFAPPVVPQASPFLVQAFLHLRAGLTAAAQKAVENDPSANRRGAATLDALIARGSVVTMMLESKDLSIFSHILQHATWDGTVKGVMFIVEPAPTAAGKVDAVLTLSIDDLPVGEIEFTVHIKQVEQSIQVSTFVSSSALAPGTSTQSQLVGTRSTRFEKAFISYSRKDFRDVSLFAQGLAEKDIKPTIDVSDLEPGDDWESRLAVYVDAADVFYLMWSDHAAQSRYVEWEAKRAVTRLDGAASDAEKRPRIKPIPLQQPYPPPPDYLKRFHFHSEWHAHRAVFGTAPPTR